MNGCIPFFPETKEILSLYGGKKTQSSTTQNRFYEQKAPSFFIEKERMCGEVVQLSFVYFPFQVFLLLFVFVQKVQQF